ncbi:type VI secretion system tube protein TssD [Spongiivirga sp. MCCC 1A20706]|uniref:type VI secretion system tube protein TssD n=1 Tax=Spongiivirga sp. MCCC 1A20706 TaxID=3160963 RepID=UPI003977BDF2
MSFKATLHIFEKTYNALDLNYKINQQTDLNGRPTRRALGGTIHVKIESTKDDLGLYEAMFSPTQSVQGSIRVYKRDGFSKSFDIEFANAYVVGLNENYNAISNQPLHMDITISAQILRIRNTVFELPANPSNPFKEFKATITERETTNDEPELLDYYITDLEENKIDEAVPGDKILLNVLTKNLKGEVLTITLENPTADYKYKGQLLENDTLTDYSVKYDHEKIELEVITQGSEE